MLVLNIRFISGFQTVALEPKMFHSAFERGFRHTSNLEKIKILNYFFFLIFLLFLFSSELKHSATIYYFQKLADSLDTSEFEDNLRELKESAVWEDHPKLQSYVEKQWLKDDYHKVFSITLSETG